MKKTKFTLLSFGLLFSVIYSLHGEPLRRIKLDGSEGLPAPVAELADKEGLIYLVRSVPVPMLELFSTTQKPSRGTVLVFPGGGYRSLSVTHEGYNVAQKLNEFGFDAAVLLYHLRPDSETKEQAQDLALANATEALRLVQKRGPEFGLSNKKIGLIGFSAGGHLAARLTHTTASSSPPDFAALIYPGHLNLNGKLVEDCAPIKIPLFLYTAVNDPGFANSVVFASACEEKKIPLTFLKPEKGGHGFGIRDHIAPEVKDLPDKLQQFLMPFK